MSVTYGFYNSLNGDRKYNTNQLSELFDGIIRDGVFMSVGDALIVSAAEGMNVNVGSGRAWFNHTWTNNDAPILLPITQSEVVLDRIDTVVLEVNSNDDVRANAIKVIKGTPSSEPVATELVRNEFVNQYPLARISISAGATEITASDIENTIGTSACPFVSGVVSSINATNLFAQWNGEFDDWMAEIGAAFNGFDNEFHTWMTEIGIEFSGWDTEFHDWMALLQTVLDENVAGNLLNLINNHKDDALPHKFSDGGTTYKYGFSAANGVLSFNYEEVV